MEGYSAFPKSPVLLEPHHQIIYVIPRTLVGGGGSYLSAEKQSMYSKAPAKWTIAKAGVKNSQIIIIMIIIIIIII